MTAFFFSSNDNGNDHLKSGQLWSEGLGAPHIPACLLILNKKKVAARKGKVFFLYGARDPLQLKNQNKLRPEDLEKIAKAFHSYATTEKYCRPVSLDEIRRNDYNLNITRYMDIAEDEALINVQQTINDLIKLKKERAQAEEKVEGYLKELGYKTNA